MKHGFIYIAALLLIASLSTVAWCDDGDVIVEAGPGYEIVDVEVEETYDETYGTIESVTITWAPAESTTGTTALVIAGASVVFLGAMAWGRRKTK